MGDVLPPKRQSVVDRLKVRLEQYRWRQKSCLIRYEKSAASQCEKQRQDTVRLKQKFLESNAKKTKNSKADHHRTNASARELTPDTQKLISHPKPVKSLAEGSPANSTADISLDELERPQKATTQPENAAESVKEQPKTPNFALQLPKQLKKNSKASHAQASQKSNVSVESSPQTASPINQNKLLAPKKNVPKNAILNQNRTNQPDTICSIECKREVDKPPDICQFKDIPASSGIASSDRLSDTFPSIGFAEDSGDDVIHPDILKDLIDDVFTNSADIMKDFNFEDTVGSIKDNEKDEIGELVKDAVPVSEMQTFQTDGLMFNNHSISQEHPQSSVMFENSSVASSTSNVSLMPTTTTTASTANLVMYRSQPRLPTYSSSSNMGLANSLNLDFKLSEPSPAALTLKQMAEQHQNMQQKHHLNNNMNTSYHMNQPMRNQYSLDSFGNTAGNFGTRFVQRPAQRNQAPVMYQATSYQPAGNYPGMVPMGNNNVFKQETCNVRPNGLLINAGDQKSAMLQLVQSSDDKKHPVCGNTDALSFFGDNVSNQHLVANQYMRSDVQLQMGQSQHHIPSAVQSLSRPMHNVTTDIKQAENMQERYSNMYAYNSPQGNAHVFNLPQNPSYNTLYNTASSSVRLPPEYKMSQSNTAGHGNVLIDPSQLQLSSYQQQQSIMQHPSPSGISANEWWPVQQRNHTNPEMFQHQETYANLNCTGSIPSNVSQVVLHHPYRATAQLPSGKMHSPGIANTNHPLLQQQSQHINSHLHRTGMSNMDTSLGNSSILQMYSSHQDINQRQDNQINLDFLDNIESSASDLLNFDQVIQNSGSTNFQLFEDMEMLSK